MVADGLVALVVVLEAGVPEVVVRGDRPALADREGGDPDRAVADTGPSASTVSVNGKPAG